MVHVQATLLRICVGYGIGATAGVLLGVVMGLHAPTRAAIAPTLYGIFPMPKIAIYPLMIVIFGLGDASSSALVTLGVFFMTCINTFAGVRYVNPIYHDVADAFRFPPLVRWFRVFIPAAMPSIITGLRLGLGQALVPLSQPSSSPPIPASDASSGIRGRFWTCRACSWASPSC